MANAEHIEIIRQGVKKWNEYRDAVKFVPDFSGHSFRGAYLGGVNLRSANLRDADFSLANLRGADLEGADTSGASFTGASISGAKLSPDFNEGGANFEMPPDEKGPSLADSLRDQRSDERLKRKIERLYEVDIPERRYKILNVVVEETLVRASTVSVPSGTPFADVFETVERLARDIAAAGYLANTAPSLDRAIRRYIEAIDEYYEGGGEILLGLSGQICLREFSAHESSLENIGVERTGTIKSFLFSHGLLEKLMPNWMAMLNDAELSSVLGKEREVEEITNAIVSDLKKNPKVDETLPFSIQRILDAKKRGNITIKSATFAVLRAIEDIMIELFSLVVATYKSTKENFTKMSGVVISASVISAIYFAGAKKLTELSPSLYSWITRGVQWLKEFGLLG